MMMEVVLCNQAKVAPMAMGAPRTCVTVSGASRRPQPRSRISIIVASAATASSAVTKEKKKKNLYGVLGVRVGASQDEIKASYRRLARQLHPDSSSSLASTADFIALHSAYSVLSDPQLRAKYDCALFGMAGLGFSFSSSSSSSSSSSHVPPGFTRNWETDQCW